MACETCTICDATNELVFDGLCPTCEEVWLDQIRKAPKTPDMKLRDLFAVAAINARALIRLRKRQGGEGERCATAYKGSTGN